MALRKALNPFYVLLVLVGIVFFITACAYGVMTVKGLQPNVNSATAEPHPLLAWLDQNGFQLMLWELALLALSSVAAIGTDSFWERRHRQAEEADSG